MIPGIQPLSEAAEITDPAFIFYGPPGSGKTSAAIMLLCEMAKRRGKRVLWLDMDRKLASQENLTPEQRAIIDIWMPKEPLSGKSIGVARIPQYEGQGNSRHVVHGTEGWIPENPKGYLELRDIINKLLADPKTADVYVGVCLDTATTVEEHLQRLICSHHKRGTFTTELWGVYGSNWAEMRAGFLSLPGIKVMNIHMQEKGDPEKGQTIRVIPAIQGYTGDRIAKDYNEVWYFEGRETGQDGKYMLRIASNPKFTAPRTSYTGISGERISVNEMLAKVFRKLK